jgi:hypothetical protein
MSILTSQGKHVMSILKKIKEYPDYKKHLPLIITGVDILNEYIDYYIAESDNNIADVLFIQTVMPIPGNMWNHDAMTIIVDPNNITSITFDTDYYKFNVSEVVPVISMGLDLAILYKTLLRLMEYGCLNWGVPFRRYGLRINDSLYASWIGSLNCKDDNAFFSLYGNLFSPSSSQPIILGNTSLSYNDIKMLYVPTMYLNTIGGMLGVYPSDLIAYFNALLAQRRILNKPIDWMTTAERRKSITEPYIYGQTVFSKETLKSYISLINNNIYNPDDEKSITSGAWKEISYNKPASNDLVPDIVSNPIETLLGLFNTTFDISSITP